MLKMDVLKWKIRLKIHIRCHSNVYELSRSSYHQWRRNWGWMEWSIPCSSFGAFSFLIYMQPIHWQCIVLFLYFIC